MHPPFNQNLKEIADSMGVGMYQRFSLNEASLFLRFPEGEIKKLSGLGEIGCIKLASNQIGFFCYQLLEFLLSTVKERVSIAPIFDSPDRILRSDEVQSMTGLSRTSIWRAERKGRFPARVPLSAGSVGWRLSDVEAWIKTR